MLIIAKHRAMTIYISLLFCIATSVGFSTYLANEVADNSGRAAVCQLLTAEIESSKEVPPQTDAGKNLIKTRITLYKTNCL